MPHNNVYSSACSNTAILPPIPALASTFSLQSSVSTFLGASFLTDLRLERRSMETLCLEPRRAFNIWSADILTRLRGGRLNLPRRSKIFGSIPRFRCRSSQPSFRCRILLHQPSQAWRAKFHKVALGKAVKVIKWLKTAGQGGFLFFSFLL